MNMNIDDDVQHGQSDDGDLARLLAASGRRQQPTAAAIADVRAEVEAEWRRTLAARQQRRRYTAWAAAAGVAVAAVAVWVARPLYLPDAGPVATLARVVGEVQVDSGDGHWSALSAGRSIGAGAVIRTGSSGRAALRMEDGVELRLDTGTQLAFNNEHEANLARGAVYVDSGPDTGAPAARFVLQTSAGNVRHLGTQYEARLADSDLRVGVREGRVEVTAPRGTVLAGAGELLTIRADSVSRTPLSPSAADWNWVGDVTPAFSIEGRSVDDFLNWAARETGRTVVYSSPEIELQARNVRLRGTVEGLAPEQAVTAVLTTTSLEPVVGPNQIRIESAPR
jgi:ferric-dicitrate binding protein FerR (iron transport regulator)